MNKGLKKYTKQLQFNTGLATAYINLNKNDSNTHITVPLIDIDGPCPISLSLIYDNLNKDSSTIFGKGFKLNLFKNISKLVGKITVTNADGSTDEFTYDSTTDKYTNPYAGLSVTVDSVSDGYSTLLKGYTFEDLNGNTTKYAISSNYPSSVTMKSGACYDFDFISSPITITNNINDTIRLYKTGQVITEIKYEDTSIILTYDANNQINTISYKRGEIELGNISFLMYDDSIDIYDNYNMKSLHISFDINGRTNKVNEGILDADIERITTITYNDKETVVENYLGNLVRVVFDEEDYPNYVINKDGVVNATEYNHNVRKVVYQSADIDCIHKLPNLLDSDNIDFINFSNGATVTTATLPQDNFYSKIIGDSLRRVTTTTNVSRGLETLPIQGLAGESFTVALWGRCVQEGSTPCELRVGIGSANKRVRLRKDGLFNFISTGFTASEAFNTMGMSIIIDKGCVVEIGGLQIIKKQFGVEYKYDEKGNLVSITQNGTTNSISYDSKSNLPTKTVDANSMVYSYEYDDKGNVVKTYGAYCVNTENTYIDSSIRRLLSTKTSNKNGSKILSKSNTFDSSNQNVISETDELGNVTRFENIDKYGAIGKIIYANNSIMESDYDNGLLKTLRLLSSSNELMSCSYTYDAQNRVAEVMLKNGSKYSFSYDCANNITEIRLNNMAIYKFRYDLVKNNLVSQIYGDNTSYIFNYNNDNMLSDVYYKIKDTSRLKYHYRYDDKKRLSSVEDSQGIVLRSYVYDNEDRVIEEKASDYSIKRSLSAEGEVLATSNTVSGNTISQSYSPISQSKSFNPDSLASTFYGDYFGAFTKNTALMCKNGGVGNVYEKTLNPDSFANNGSPYVSIDSDHLLGYVFDHKFSSDSFCCTAMMWIKPKKLTNNKVVFMVQSASNGCSLTGKLYNSKLQIVLKDGNDIQKTLATTTSMLKLNKWNFVAIHFRRRYDGEGYGDEKKMFIMLNQEIIKVEESKLGNFTTSDFNYPLYTISHGTTISADDENKPVFNAFDVLDSDVSCLTITNRYGVTIKEMQTYYNETKLYIMDTMLKESDLASVDFSTTSLHSNNTTFNKNFTLYPLQNEFKSTNGDEPIAWSYRKNYNNNAGKSFAFDRVTKGYAYIADGAELVLKSNYNNAKTILMRVFIESGINSFYTTEYPNDTSKIKRYIFDMADDENVSIALGLDKDNKLVLNRFGTERILDYTLDTNQWYTMAFSYGIVNGKWQWVVIIDNNVVIDEPGTFGLYKDTAKVSIGRKYIPYDSDTHSRFNELEYYPLYGQIKQVAISDKYFNPSEVISLLDNLLEINKVTMFDEIGMLNKTVLSNDNRLILSNSYTYKTQADTQLANVVGANKEELAKHISPIVKAEEIKCGSTTTTTRTYTTDSMGNVTAITDSVFGNHKYTYDSRQFLTKADDEAYEYDSNGNITKIGDRILCYDHPIKDKLTSVDGKAVNYASDASLNPSSYNGNQYFYEGRRLIKYMPQSNTLTKYTYEYMYDEKGLRTKKIWTIQRPNISLTTTTNFFYDNNNKLIGQTKNNKHMEFLYDEKGQLYGLFYNGTKYFYVRDVLQNILGIVDSNGSIVVKYNYTGYGVTTVSGSLATTLGKDNPFRFKGYYFDEESSMYYCKSRYYVPEWGRWLNADSPSNLDKFSLKDLNLFAYCYNNPINYFDPSGNSAVVVISIIILIIGAAAGAGIAASIGKKEGKKGWELAKTIILGTLLGVAIAGLALVFGGMIASFFGAFIAAAKTALVIGALGFNFFALLVAPLYGIEVEPLDISPMPGQPISPYDGPGKEYEHPANKKKK